MGQNRRAFLGKCGWIALGSSLLGFRPSWTSDRDRKNIKQRFALAIDVKRLADPALLSEIVLMCHKTHNVPIIPKTSNQVWWCKKAPLQEALESWEETTVPKTLGELDTLVLCNHCENPSCVRVCPTGATFKRPNGVVSVDAHRCIGCRYCMAACPYGARSFNYLNPKPFIHDQRPDFPIRTKGVVEKCNLCEERLVEGKAPLCASLANGAMIFGNLEEQDSQLVRALAERPNVVRKPWLGTKPKVFYLL